MTAHNLAFKETEPEIDTAKVRELNDAFHRDLYNAALGQVFFTAGVAALKDEIRFMLVDKVHCFEDFSESNDPHKEHDFGRIDFRGIRYFWKIDYYDRDMQFHSPNKSDPKQTMCVLTIM
jgi:hypothetical protein